jgi:isopentenyl diphosphate isomerase/L-lactate dehydrogenase-like FMN-dependent dehydrogenase
MGTGDPSADGLVAVRDFEAPAAERLTGPTWAYVTGGAGDEVTLRESHEAWARHGLLPRSMVDVSALSTRTTLLGRTHAHPVLIAPTATHLRYHPGAERETLRGAIEAETLMTLSTLGSTLAIEFGAAATEASSPWWMQVYLQNDRAVTRPILDAAVAGGASALVLTVDTPSLGARDRDKRDSLGAAQGVVMPNLAHHAPEPDPTPAQRRVWNAHLSNTVTPRDIALLAERYGVPVIPKGILRSDDARRAVDAGAAAVIVSNHGARNLDSAPATADVLASVVAEVGGDVPVLVDGGIRRGTDVATALCLGATAVLVGRPVIWGLATYGATGVRTVIDILRTELEMAMALLGAPTVADLTPELLGRR